jgi:hypothetical protein
MAAWSQMGYIMIAPITRKGLTRFLTILVFALLISAAYQVLPVWAEEISDPADNSACPSITADSGLSSQPNTDSGCNLTDNSADESDTSTTDGTSENATDRATENADTDYGSINMNNSNDGSENSDLDSETEAAAEIEADDSGNMSDFTTDTDLGNEGTISSENPAAEDTGSDTSTTSHSPPLSDSADYTGNPTEPAPTGESSITTPTDSDTAVENSPNDNSISGDSEVSNGSGPYDEPLNHDDESQPQEVLSENTVSALEPENADDAVTISQSSDCIGDPWGYILDAVTALAVTGAQVEVWKIAADGTAANSGIINEDNPVVTDSTGKYSFTVKETANYQLKVSKDGYADLLTQIYSFDKDAVTPVGNLYLLPLTADAGGNDVIIEGHHSTGGRNISISNASSLTLADGTTIDA